MGWPVCIVTGKRYRFHWGEGIDFETMRLEIKDYSWEETDLNVKMMTNFTDVRMSINATGQDGILIANETFLQPEADLIHGDNVIYN